MRAAALTVRIRSQEEFVFDITEAETLIGRSPRSHLRLRDSSISREHAVILYEEDTFTVEDLQSTNGTQVNGKRIRSAALSHGDEIRVGQTQILFTLP